MVLLRESGMTQPEIADATGVSLSTVNRAVRKAKRIAAKRRRRLRIMFADEARFGRMNRPRPCWAPPGETSGRLAAHS
jgi:transcriptional regulator with XRE-family HTH domain